MDSGIVGRLQHDTGMCGVHFVDGERSVTRSVAASTLLPHPVGHEESLVWLLRTKPIRIIIVKIYNLKINLHSVDSLGRRLGLCSSEILLLVLVDQGIRQRTVRHRVLVHSVLLKV